MKRITLAGLSLVLLLGIATFTLSANKSVVQETIPEERVAGIALKDTIEGMQEEMGRASMGSDAGHYFAATMIPYYRAGTRLSRQLGLLSKDRYVAELAGEMVSAQNRTLREMQVWQTEGRRADRLSDSSKRSFLRLMYEVKGSAWEDMRPALDASSPEYSCVTLLIAHSQGAVDMAKVLLIFESDQELRKLANRIIAEEQRGIRSMQAWLRERDRL